MEQREFMVEAEAAGQHIDRFHGRRGYQPFPQCFAVSCSRGPCALQRKTDRQKPQAGKAIPFCWKSGCKAH